jgi:hypothetical protein
MSGFHPEFGLLCPSPRRRRCIRLVMLSVATTLTIGATMGLAIAHRTDGEDPASMVQPMDERAPAGVSTTADGADVRESCKANVATDLASYFLGSACAPNKPHARHGARATNRVATVILGRVDAPAATAAPSAAVAAPASEPPQPGAGKAEKSASVTAAVERTAPPKKPKAKATGPIALTPAGGMLGAPTPNAYASAPKLGREAYDPYRDTFRSTPRQSGFDAPFGWVR